jgi:hypothetical protein
MPPRPLVATDRPSPLSSTLSASHGSYLVPALFGRMGFVDHASELEPVDVVPVIECGKVRPKRHGEGSTAMEVGCRRRRPNWRRAEDHEQEDHGSGEGYGRGLICMFIPPASTAESR